MKSSSLISILLFVSSMRQQFTTAQPGDTGYQVISDETYQDRKDLFEEKCDIVRLVKLVIAARDVSGGIQILQRMDQAANVELKMENNYYYSIIICYDVLNTDGKTRNILNKRIFFNLNDNGKMNPLPEGCPVPIPPFE